MNKVVFDKENHIYTLLNSDGEKMHDLISVTTLLVKHGLAPDYSFVNEKVLERKADRGTIVHEELENYIKSGEAGFTSEVSLFIEQVKDKLIKPLHSETVLYNDEVAGTVDIIGEIGANGLMFIGDFKTSAKLYKEAVAWQLSLYAYLCKDYIFEKYLVFHFPDPMTCKVVEIEPIPTDEVEELLRCERDCEIYKTKTLELSKSDLKKVLTVQKKMMELEEKKKELEVQEFELKKFLIEKMEENEVKVIDNDFFRITYVSPSQREMIDSARLRKEKPEIASEYTKTSFSRASVRIKLKD